MTDSYFSRRGIFANGQWSLFLVAGLILLMLAMRAVDVFEGTVPDNDDLLRLQQVRDLIAGQAWFNVDQARMLTPEGGEMHWSRLPDIFLASIIYVTQPLLGQTHAEMLAMSVWPLVLLTWTLAMLVTVLRRLGRAGCRPHLLRFVRRDLQFLARPDRPPQSDRSVNAYGVCGCYFC